MKGLVTQSEQQIATDLRPTVVLAMLLTTVVLSGCAAGAVTGTAYAAGGGATLAAHEERQQYKEKLNRDYAEYKELFTASNCDPDEYRIGPEIMEDLRESDGPTEDGFGDVQDRLWDVHNDDSQPADVRAHALYLIALAEAEKEDGSREQARDYLRQVKSRYPGTHDCAVDVLLERGYIITEPRDA